ncbi:unnamed protein product, partial [Mesorhabditis spiculigera]
MRTILCLLYLFCLETTQTDDQSAVAQIASFFLRARDTCLYAGALHMLLLAGERLLATAKSKTYETERHHSVFIVAISIMWIASIIMMFYLKNGKITQYIFAGLYAVSDLIAIMLMLIVNRLNYHNFVAKQGTLEISEGYQIRENVSTSMLLNRAFVVMVIMTLSGLTSYFGYIYFENELYRRVFGFLFDVTVALPTVVIPMMLLVGNEKMRKIGKRILKQKTNGRPSPVSHESKTHYVDFQGNKVPLRVEDEQAAYFSLYQSQWEQAVPLKKKIAL